MNELDKLAIKYGTDKSSEYHNYTDIYYRFFDFNRENIKNVLEIGVLEGKSIRMWKDYFNNAMIYAIDINPKCKFKDERINILIGDQTDTNLIETLPNNFDIIIDDGGHQSEKQIESFKLLFPKLKLGGIYVVEDVCCSYWSEFNSNNKQTAIEYFKTLVDYVNFFGYKTNDSYRRDRSFLINNKPNVTEFEKLIDYIIFVNSLIFIKKIN